MCSRGSDMYNNWRSTNTLTVFHVAFRWLSKADVPTWQQWHRLCNHLHDHVQPTCETSYLSQKKVCACEVSSVCKRSGPFSKTYFRLSNSCFSRLGCMLAPMHNLVSHATLVPADQVGHFWQYLVNSFPETLDFLASVSERERDEFVNVIEVNAQNPGLLMINSTLVLARC